MEQASPWFFCVGVFCLWPLTLGVLGYYLGRHGSPVRFIWRGIKGERNEAED